MSKKVPPKKEDKPAAAPKEEAKPAATAEAAPKPQKAEARQFLKAMKPFEKLNKKKTV